MSIVFLGITGILAVLEAVRSTDELKTQGRDRHGHERGFSPESAGPAPGHGRIRFRAEDRRGDRDRPQCAGKRACQIDGIVQGLQQGAAKAIKAVESIVAVVRQEVQGAAGRLRDLSGRFQEILGGFKCDFDTP